MLSSPHEESTPVPGHVSVDPYHESSTSPVTLDSSSLSAKHLFRDEIEQSSLQIPCRISRQGNEPSDEELLIFIEDKKKEIQNCLNGGLRLLSPSKNRDFDEEDDKIVVDLWHLRQLALSKGGLLNASIRKQAWLKLIDANENIFTKGVTLDTITGKNKSRGDPSKDVAKLSDHEINLIKEDIKNCIWNLEAEMKRSRISCTPSKSIATHDEYADSIDEMTALGDPDEYTPTPLPQSAPEHIATVFPGDNSTMSPGRYSIEHPGSPKFARRKKEESSLLLNIITSILRTSPTEVKDLGMERLFYFPGMHNVVAPILITLESPSLTSLAVARLSMYHMKDSVCPTFDDIQSAIRSMLLPLLEFFDKPLHDLLVKGGISDPCSFALRWILCWFTSDIQDYNVIARLFDAFIVSHHLFPIYTAVAMITFGPNRSRIEIAAENGGGELLAETLFNIPSNVARSQSHNGAITSIESIIETSISYIKEVPPIRALELAKRSANSLVASSVLITSKTRYRPLWTYKSSAYTDWNLIQQATSIRDMSPRTLAERQHHRREKLNEVEQHYCLVKNNESALNACSANELLGDFVCKNDLPSSLSRSRPVLKFLLLICALLFFSIFINHGIENETIDDLNIIVYGRAFTSKAVQETISETVEGVKEYVAKDPDLFIIMM